MGNCLDIHHVNGRICIKDEHFIAHISQNATPQVCRGIYVQPSEALNGGGYIHKTKGGSLV